VITGPGQQQKNSYATVIGHGAEERS